MNLLFPVIIAIVMFLLIVIYSLRDGVDAFFGEHSYTWVFTGEAVGFFIAIVLALYLYS